MRSAFSSVTSRRVLRTAVVGSVASSSVTMRIFWPAIWSGQSLKPLLTGMPSAEVGPVKGSTTPMVMSARAAAAAVARAHDGAMRVAFSIMS